MTQSVSGSTTVTYQYDHEGNRVKQSNGTTTTVYPNGYYDVEGTDVRRHLLAGALGSVATSTWDGTDSDIVYHHKDHLGGTHVETDESGAVLEYLIYKPFGDSLVDSKSGTYENDKKFTGKEKDSTTGYYYYGARYYKADIGRFLSQDPVFVKLGMDQKMTRRILRDPQLLNSYSYVNNNPLKFVDPDGQLLFLAPLAVMALVSAPEIAAAGLVATTAIGSIMISNSIDDMKNPNNSTLTRVIAGVALVGSMSPTSTLPSIIKPTVFRSFSSFSSFKYWNGAAGTGREWHHIVEQTAGNMQRFGSEAVHNSQNLVNIDRPVHNVISGYYSSIRGFTGGKTVREWLGSQSFDQQMQFGRDVMQKAISGKLK